MGELLASVYDCLIAPFDPMGVARWRRWAVDAAHGRVLELGAGTGLNLPHYRSSPNGGAERSADRPNVVAAIDPDLAYLRRAWPRRNGQPGIVLSQARAEELPFASSSFDVVLGTLVFCTIGDPNLALKEVARVLRPGGQFRLVEHVRVRNHVLARLQDLITPAWKQFTGGCHLNRDTVAALEKGGFHVRAVHQLFGNLFVGIDSMRR